MERPYIHKNIKKKLEDFIENQKIPHIVFHGEVGSGKRHILYFFIDKIYQNIKKKKDFIMYVNCAHGKGIRFFRDELKFFAKTNIQNKKGNFFKSIILFNADKLTTDAQSALRRCIEKYSHTTRFFIIVEKKEKLLKPILSRFCDIFVPLPLINKERKNLHTYNLQLFKPNNFEKSRKIWLKKNLFMENNFSSLLKCYQFAEILYERAYSFLDIFSIMNKNISEKKNFLYLSHFDKIRKEFRDERLLLFYILYFRFMRIKHHLENIEIV